VLDTGGIVGVHCPRCGAWVGRTGRVELKNDKGVNVTLEGSRVGLEFAANLISFNSVFDQPVN
jgi:hypothetical protein